MISTKRFHQILTVVFQLVLLNSVSSFAQHVPFTGNETSTWQECIKVYESLDQNSDIAQLRSVGTTDIGKPLHLFIINKDRQFYPELFDRSKTVLLINNAIHPGEPDGVDACEMLCRELLETTNLLHQLLDSVIICIIPIYNVDGALNRGSYSRANQDGPAEYGFRGNARNLDLNRDFVKCDSRNAKSFTRIFRAVDPDVFVDTHVSNGADYPYTMTLITTQSDKLGAEAGHFLKTVFTPALFDSMKLKNDEMCPYVNTMGRTPESGLVGFMETPRFASGYAALYSTFGFITETHMLKPFAKRVESTYHFLVSLLEFCDGNGNLIRQARKQARQSVERQNEFFLDWELDSSCKEPFLFRGYEAKQKPVDNMPGQRLYYDQSASWQEQINCYNSYLGSKRVTAPDAYIIPQAWHQVIERLQWNEVIMERLEKDTTLTVEAYYIENFETSDQPYEGHYLHSDVVVSMRKMKIQFFAGDYLIPMDQEAKRYIIEVLEPQGVDSFFAWNFFDSVLQQKEWFSDYVFEDKASDLLANDASLKMEFDDAMLKDESLRNSRWQQLAWIYRHSPYYETSAFRYPVYRFE